jgi:hypothetical protein
VNTALIVPIASGVSIAQGHHHPIVSKRSAVSHVPTLGRCDPVVTAKVEWEIKMTFQNKTEPGFFGYLLILVIFVSVIAPALS